MKKAGDDFQGFLETRRNPSPSGNVLSNFMGDFYREEDDLNGILAKHIYSPVRLSDCLSRLESKEGDIHILLGPGKTLLPVVRGNNLKGKIFTIESVGSFQKLLDDVRRE
jgi:[acyl-carrier-protein] S-malonyltransferase